MRQTELAGADIRTDRVVSPRENFRLNPAEHRHSVRMELSGSVLVGETGFKLDDGIVVEGRLKCGIATRISSKPSAYRGVAAKLTLSPDDQVIAELVLLHRDPSLHVPVARSNDMDELAADWQMWARRFNLPLILIEPDGREQMISNRVGALDIAPSKQRRPNALFTKRRPRFLKRRKTGAINSEHRVTGREIIART
ncbi:MAG: hypothetical protein H2045_05270 [Rhizobiales bacterium]|nr:hypothetical protein [Hyphomicrobiales bacterium]